MKRYFLSPIVGSGTVEDSFRPALDVAAGQTNESVIPVHLSGPLIGTPIFACCFGMVASGNMPSVAATPNVFLFPDFALDARMDAMGADVRAAMNQSAGAYVILADPLTRLDMGFYGDAWTYREVLTGIVRQFDPLVTVDEIDVPEPGGV